MHCCISYVAIYLVLKLASKKEPCHFKKRSRRRRNLYSENKAFIQDFLLVKVELQKLRGWWWEKFKLNGRRVTILLSVVFPLMNCLMTFKKKITRILSFKVNYSIIVPYVYLKKEVRMRKFYFKALTHLFRIYMALCEGSHFRTPSRFQLLNAAKN